MGPQWGECNACQNSVGNRTLPHKTWANIQTTDYLGLELFLLFSTTGHPGLGTGATSGIPSRPAVYRFWTGNSTRYFLKGSSIIYANQKTLSHVSFSYLR